MIRGQAKLSTIALIPGLSLDLNPTSQQLGTARVLRNFVIERNRMARKPFSPEFTSKPSTAGGVVWHARNFRYLRAGARENRLLVFRSDGKVYRRQSGGEQELFPASDTSGVHGPRSPSAAVSTGSGTPWSNPTNVFAQDGLFASIDVPADNPSQDLNTTGYGFSVPSSNLIVGIVVTIVWRSSGGPIVISDLGSSTDLWGVSWSADDINASNFGARIFVAPIDAIFGTAKAGLLRAGSPVGDVRTFAFPPVLAPFDIDHVKITVYTDSGPPRVLTRKPFAQQLSNRFFFNDGVHKKVYDGRDVQDWGLPRTPTPPAVSAVAGSLTAQTGLKAAITWVVLDEEGNRVHESSRTDKSAFQPLSAQNLRVDIAALTPPSRATHWSAYVSELDGSEILRRVTTTPIATKTVDISALPAATAPEAPIRNDPPPPSTVGWIGKNRIFLRDDKEPSRFWFSALGEVRGLLNGAPEESFPGYGENSISDLVNSDFIPDQEIRAGIEHEDTQFIFSERYGYALVGELNLLDDRSPRSLTKLRFVSENCAGPDAIASTPFGLVWMNSGRKVLLWQGGQQLLNIGEPIQPVLDNIENADLGQVVLSWWSGNGRQWLVLNCRTRGVDNAPGAGASWRTFIYDFATPQRQDRPGTWFEWTDVAATTSGVFYDDAGQPFLLLGAADSTVRVADRVMHPAHLARSAILGDTYLGSSVQANPQAIFRTGLIMPNGDGWTIGNYLQLLTGAQDGPGEPAAGVLTQPTIRLAVDVENPDLVVADIPLTLDAALTSGDRRAWLVPAVGGNVGGAFGKHFIFELEYPAGVDDTGEADGRKSTRLNTIYRAAFAFVPQKDLAK